jgi:hypothetical protein
MIAEAEDILFPAHREHSQVAILYPRSSEMWDEWHTELVAGMCMCCCVTSMVSRYIDYTVEAYGLYLALATDSNIPVDFIVRSLSDLCDLEVFCTDLEGFACRTKMRWRSRRCSLATS